MKKLRLKDYILLIVAVTIFKFSGHMHALDYNFWSWGAMMGIGWFILYVVFDEKEVD